ncbi:unnamed protein product [Microthlaspi erraticum]|uniref:Uncharacterized protein n=1 Tax=Microthlaspi erraticum TaxID=1685480 RepID=A0A6D2I7T6_9BRAS|nr:unnamed protein product [Microthlaspi erraticum]
MLQPLPEIAESINDVICHELSMWPEDANDLLLIVEAISRGDLKLVLAACAKAVFENNLLMARWCMGELRGMVSISGEPIQRLGAYMLEGLVARLSATGSSIYKSLQSREPESYEFLSYVYVLHEVCPYFKFGYMSANGAIAEAMKDEERIHIIDFQIGQGSQWIALIQAFAARPCGAPSIRITGIGDDGSNLVTVKKRLEKLAEKFHVPFKFNAVSRTSCEVEVEDLDVRKGEALGVNFAYMLHHLPDESVSMENHRDRVLRMVKKRLGAYMLEGLVARLSATGSSIYKSLQSREPESYEFLSYVYVLHEVCPYFKFGYMSANGAIAEAMKDEERIHIIDFQIGQGSQWIALIQAFAARPCGAPSIRITGIGDDGSNLVTVKKRLEKLAEKFHVPFKFNAVSRTSCEVEVEDLDVRKGEALGVNFAYMLHHLPDESVSMENHRDRVLRMVKSLSPKVVTLVEQECNTNTSPFLPRFLETLSYYTAMFESIDVMLPRNHKERINVEQHCLARDVVNIIACEGAERIERHELLGKWKSRFSMAGFEPYPLSSLVSATIRALLKDYSNGYGVEERDGALYLGWMNRILVSSCAWK